MEISLNQFACILNLNHPQLDLSFSIYYITICKIQMASNQMDSTTKLPYWFSECNTSNGIC